MVDKYVYLPCNTQSNNFIVMNQYEIFPIFQLTNIAFPILANTNSQSDINLASKSANNRHHRAMKL